MARPLQQTSLRPRQAGRGSRALRQGAAHRAYVVATAGLVLTMAMLLCSAALHAATYKWVDERGVVHYSDKIPQEAINKGNVQLNKEGIAIKRTDPALTPEQRRAREAEEERLRQNARDHEAIERRDRALLSTYTTESEIELARSRALSTIDGQVQSANGYSVLLNKRKADLEGRIAASAGKPVSAAMERELANVNGELARQAELIAAKHKEAAIVTARYDADKKRWGEMRARVEASANGTLKPTTAKQ